MKKKSIDDYFSQLGKIEKKLKGKIEKEGKIQESEKVKNIKPTISALKISPLDLNTDPVVVKVTAV